MYLKIFTLVLGLCLSAPTLVSAHSKAKGNTPAVGAIVETGQTELQVNFSKKVRVTSFKMYLLTADQDPLSEDLDMSFSAQIDPTEKLSKSFSKKLNVSFSPLTKGVYTYKWIAIAKDGHKINGIGHFSVAD